MKKVYFPLLTKYLVSNVWFAVKIQEWLDLYSPVLEKVMQMDILKIADSPKKKPYFKLHKGSVQHVGSSRSQVKIGSVSSGAKSLIPVKSKCLYFICFVTTLLWWTFQ